MEHRTTVEALLVTDAERDTGLGSFAIIEDAHGDYSVVDGSGMYHGDSMGLSEALETAEMLAVRFDVERLTRGGLPRDDAEEIADRIEALPGYSAAEPSGSLFLALHQGPGYEPQAPISEATAETFIRALLDPPEACVVTMSSREHDAVVAGLRLLTKAFANDWIDRDDGDIGAILTCSGNHPGLSVDAIHDLADALLSGARDPR